MRLKAKNQNEMAIEKFVAQSSKSAKYAKTTVKKRDPSASASADPMRKADGAMSAASAAAASGFRRFVVCGCDLSDVSRIL